MQNNLGESANRQPLGKRGSLYCLAGNQLTRHETNLGIPNTLLWSPDGKTFYLGDSLDAKLYRYEFDGVSIYNQQIFSDVKSNGVPDGSAIDAQGQLWNCRWGDAAIFVFTPEGYLAQAVPIPAPQVTSCTFGGSDMTTLYVTTARHELTSSQQSEYPLSGCVFALEIGAAGSTRGRVKRL
jgi:sugar lactone lactonase YvrE